MAQRTVATSTTAAIVDPNQVAFTIQSKHFRNGQKPIVAVEGLAGVETMTFYYFVNGDWEELDDGSGTTVAFTATYAADTFNGPGTFGYIKDATAGAIVVTLNDGI